MAFATIAAGVDLASDVALKVAATFVRTPWPTNGNTITIATTANQNTIKSKSNTINTNTTGNNSNDKAMTPLPTTPPTTRPSPKRADEQTSN